MAGRYTGSYLDRSNGWRAAAIPADIGQASLVGRIPEINMISCWGENQGPDRKFSGVSVHVAGLGSAACANTLR
jgi:hypothetical protein